MHEEAKGTERQTGRNGNAGFTLIELMIALAVIATVLLGTMAAMTLGSRQTTMSREDTVARQTAERRMAALQALAFGDLAGEAGDFEPNLTAEETQLLAAPRDGGTRGSVQVAPEGALQVVTVTIRWHSVAMGGERTMTLQMKVAP